ncbi:glycoside hydrolase family 15 protein [Actinomadura bangladeshensis]|uniref:Glycoside hydrolase family 15 protein n=1 Tax=Actinomadura bangladeshensis TaxID=453573 RepID=A0A4R4NV15_9ACTN|nr:glycoside hydrolase family 15 protein [Actinomadura bangladeshensis]TDC13289.1 glycoside hydrolase family 15 protein [Actinomadura bangladeshensis]
MATDPGTPSATPTALRDYAFIADGERGVLVGPHGEYAWMCFPHWESAPAFASLLGGPGGYLVRPVGERFVWGGYYEDRGLIWHSRWVTGEGSIVECREALARPARRDRAVLLRRCRAVRGRARLRALLDVRAGGARMRGVRHHDPDWTARSGGARIRWRGADEAVVREGPDGGALLAATFDLDEGESRDLVLELAEAGAAEPAPAPGADALWEATEQDWRKAVPSCDDTIAPRDARLSYAVLTGLTSRAGGMVAAATTSLPERADEGRNFDYRYAWIRDQCFAGQAVAAHGGPPELLRGAAGFATARILADRGRLRPAYTVTGDPVPEQRDSALPGYPGARVVTGNRASEQWQLDALGESLLLLATAAEHDRAEPAAREAARVAADVIGRRWGDPGAGIWETEDRLWTHSRLICVAGLRQAARVLGGPGESASWNSLADAVLAETARTALTAGGRWRRAADDDRVDAALLIPPLRGALPTGDPRSVATLEAVRAELVQEGFVYRYRVGGEPLGVAEGSFTLCGFFLALAEHRRGETARALGTFERTRSGSATSGLFSEEYDVRQRQLRGNIPQAFVHAQLLEAASRLARGPAPY